MKDNKNVWRGQLRMPLELADWVKSRAEQKFKSANAELVEILMKAKEAHENGNLA